MAVRLSEYTSNKPTRILEVENGGESNRLAEFGFIVGNSIQVISRAPFNGPLFVQIDQNRVALRKSEAAMITVE